MGQVSEGDGTTTTGKANFNSTKERHNIQTMVDIVTVLRTLPDRSIKSLIDMIVILCA